MERGRSGNVLVRDEALDSASMAAILLDVDGVLHVSGEPIPGAVDAVRRLRSAGHRIRFVTNSTTMSRAQVSFMLSGEPVTMRTGIFAHSATAASSVNSCLPS